MVSLDASVNMSLDNDNHIETSSIDVKNQRIEYQESVENKGFPGVGTC